jgi:dihydroflavonol-4-reductase
MTAVVTGGSGLVGGAVIRRLVADGSPVVALVRGEQAARTVASLGAQPEVVDLSDVAAVAGLVQGADVLFHVAGRNVMCPGRPDLLYHDNVDVAVSVVRAAAAGGVRRVVHTSSAATLGERRGEVARETTTHRGDASSHYERSKYLGERAVLREARDLGVDVVVVNPCSVQGPGRASGSAELFLRVARATTAILVRTWISVVDIEDCAAGHVLAAERGRPGARYVLCGASLRVEDAVAALRERTGRPRRVVWAPAAVVRALGPLTALARLGRGDEDLAVCPAAVRALLHGHRYDGSKASSELGLRYRSFEESLDRTLTWAHEQRLL